MYTNFLQGKERLENIVDSVKHGCCIGSAICEVHWEVFLEWKRIGRGRQLRGERQLEAEKKKSHKLNYRVVIELGIMEYLTGEDLNFKHQAKRLNQRVKIFKAEAKLLT